MRDDQPTRKNHPFEQCSEVDVAPDEVEAIAAGRRDIREGRAVAAEEVDWDNLEGYE